MHFPETIRAGVIQFDVRRGDLSTNLQSATNAIRRLKEQGADMAVLPELWPCGFDYENIIQHAKKTPDVIDALSRTARSHRMLLAGSMPELSDGLIYNTLVVIDTDGRIAGMYRKVHLFATNQEHQNFSPGRAAAVWNTSLGPIGGVICYDIRFPELCRKLSLQGARMVLVCAQWPESRIQHWDTLLAARAIENQIFMVASNRTGSEYPLDFPGHSQIISPYGDILAKTREPVDAVSADLHFKDMENFRNLFDCLRERVPEAYGI